MKFMITKLVELIVPPRFVPKIQLFYLFFRFKIDILSTNRYLKKYWFKLKDAYIPVENVIELIPPKSELYIYNPTIIKENEQDFVFFARVTNKSYMQKTDFLERSIAREQNEIPVDAVARFLVNDQFNVFDFEYVIPLSSTPHFQDPKGFVSGDKQYLFGNYVLKYPNNQNRQFVCKVAFYDIKSKRLEVFESPLHKNIEKNWIPFKIEGDNLYMIYECKPYATLNYNLVTKDMKYDLRENSADLNYHGGSPFVKIGLDEYLRIVRYKFRFPKLGLVTLSYAMIHDEKLNIIFTSSPFIFKKFGFEICHGLALMNNELIFTWGEDDFKMFMGSISLDKFINWIYSDKTKEVLSSNFSVFKLGENQDKS